MTSHVFWAYPPDYMTGQRGTSVSPCMDTDFLPRLQLPCPDCIIVNRGTSLSSCRGQPPTMVTKSRWHTSSESRFPNLFFSYSAGPRRVKRPSLLKNDHVVPKLSQKVHKVVPKFHQVVPKLSASFLKVVSELLQVAPKVFHQMVSI